jgi:general stress protein 26
MSQLTLQDLSRQIRDIDYAMLLTHTSTGDIAGRPMSNNGDADYNGDSYYFTWQHTRMVHEIEQNPQVGLSFQAGKHLLGKPGIQISVEGLAEVVRDREAFREHWNKEFDRWFQQGVDTPGVVMIKVHARRIHYWDGMDEGEIPVM